MYVKQQNPPFLDKVIDPLQPNDYGFEMEYEEKWNPESLQMKELKFMYFLSVAHPNTVHPRNVGDFVHYSMMNIDNSENPDLKRHSTRSLNQLMTIKEDNVNLLLLTRLLSTNEFSNILKQPSEFDYQNEFIFATNTCIKQMADERSATLNMRESGSLHEEIPYIKETPCLQFNISQDCRNFCDWFVKSLNKISKKELLVLTR